MHNLHKHRQLLEQEKEKDDEKLEKMQKKQAQKR